MTIFLFLLPDSDEKREYLGKTSQEESELYQNDPVVVHIQPILGKMDFCLIIVGVILTTIGFGYFRVQSSLQKE